MKLKFLHPGWLLREEFLEPMKLSPYRLAKEIRVPLTRVMAILQGKRSVTADTGLCLDRYFGLSDGYWSGLQHDYDLRAARRELASALKQIRPPRSRGEEPELRPKLACEIARGFKPAGRHGHLRGRFNACL